MAARRRLGRKVRAARLERGLTQAALAERVGISPSYLNLIEHDRRNLSAPLLVAIARELELNLDALDERVETRLAADLNEVFSDPLFESFSIPAADVEDFVTSAPGAARAVRQLYESYRSARSSADTLAASAAERHELGEGGRALPYPDEASDFIQHHGNYFPELEEAAERIWVDAHLTVGDDFFRALADYLADRHGVTVRIRKVGEVRGALRVYDRARRELILSEALRRGSRNFQLAHQIGLLNGSEVLDRLVADPELTSDISRALARVSLASYFAGAVLMPYDRFLKAAIAERYDIDLLGHRFRSSFEQVCHRLTTLRRPSAEGVPFHFLRIDIAGNVSKRFSADGIRFPRFSGLCPLWPVHGAFLRPGMMRPQLSRLPDGTTFFTVARTVRKHRGGYHAPNVLFAIGLGCDVAHAPRLVYADGIDLTHLEAAVPVGMTCRACERVDCAARAFPSLQRPIEVDEDVRGVSFYAPVTDPEDDARERGGPGPRARR